jgi:antitoxin (DNA-binding transcriptional repressor) of toxin-antitoxin stability system
MVITIDVREFEEHSGRYVRRARDGETITVTDGG